MQPFQPLYNLNYESFFSSPHPSSQYAQSPQSFVLGEGDVASVVNPNGSYSFFFVPTMKPWLTISFNPNVPSYIHPYWYTDSGVWIIRSISNPIPWNLFLQMIQKYSNNVGEFSNYPTSQLPLPASSQQNMDTQFHNDCVTSTTDLHYFFPRPNISVNTLRMHCECNRTTEVELDSQFGAANKVNEMDVTPQYSIQKRNGLQDQVPLHFSLPQQVVCNRPCFCVQPPNSNNQNPMKAFSFRQPYQNGATENATQTLVKENDNTTISCTSEPDRPYLPCLCPSGRCGRKSEYLKSNSRKSRFKYSSSDSSDDRSSKKKKTNKSKKCLKDTENVMSVKKKQTRSTSQYSFCRCDEEESNENRKHKKNYSSNSKSQYRSKKDQKNKEYVTYLSSCDDETCPVHNENKKKTCDINTCPVRKNVESGCTNETCPERKKKRKTSSCNNETCPARQKSKESTAPPPQELGSSCNNETCPAQLSSTCSNETCPAKKNKDKSSSSSCDPEICHIETKKSIESIESWNFNVNNTSDSKESPSTCNIDTCPARKKDTPTCNKDTCPAQQRQKTKSCDDICPAEKEELIPFCEEVCSKDMTAPSCAEICPKEEITPSCAEICPKEEITPSCAEICPKEEITPSCGKICRAKQEDVSCEDICPADSKKCNINTCTARKKFVKDSEESQSKEEEYHIQYLDTVYSSSSNSDCDNENCASRKDGKNNQSKSSVMYVHRKELPNSCSNCSTCSLSTDKKSPFSWRSYINPTKSKSKSKKKESTCYCSKCTNDIKSNPSNHDKKSKKELNQQMEQLSDDNIRTTGKKYKPRICCNMGARFLIGKRRREDTNDCTCSSNSPKQDTFVCTGCRLKGTSTNAHKTTLDKHITTYNDNSTNCVKGNATQTKICKCYPRCHKKDYVLRSYKKDYEAEMWEPKINCEFNCHQFLLDLRGSVPCLYGKNMQ